MDGSGYVNLPLGEPVRYVYVCAGCGATMTKAAKCAPGCESVEAEPVQVVSAAAYEEVRAQSGRLQADWLRVCAERDALADALALRVRPGATYWRTGGQMTTWVWNDEHLAAVALLNAAGRRPIGGVNPGDRRRLNAHDTRDVPEDS